MPEPAAAPTPAPDWRASRKRRLAARSIAVAGSRLIKVLGHTWRWRTAGLEHLDAIVASGRQPVMTFWHGRIIPAAYYFRGRGIVVITSDNFDGEWAAGIIERLGFATARGSTSRGGKRAMRELIRAARSGRPAGFAVDGPRGPARRAQLGAIWLARTTGNPVLPFHIEADRHWTLSSWDRTQIPAPFATMALVVRPAFGVAPDGGESALEAARITLEEELSAAEAQSLALLHGR